MPLPEWSLVICSGGSGGHLFPALAVVEELRAGPSPPSQVLVLSTQRDIEQRILNEDALEHVPLDCPTGGDFFRRPLRSVWNLRKSIKVAQRFLQDTPAPVVLSTGGFGSVPGAVAAHQLGVPLILHEQNIVPGRATSWLAAWGDAVCLSYEETRLLLPRSATKAASGNSTERRERVILTGNPVRRSISQLAENASPHQENILLVLGGSQGAHRVNDAMIKFAANHRRDLAPWKVVHQTGNTDAQRVADSYKLHRIPSEVSPFFEDLPQRYQAASLVVTRAGGTSLAEIACAGLPALIIPYPGSVRDHQLRNAEWYSQQGAAITLPEQGKSAADLPDRLAQELLPLLQDGNRRLAMSQAMRELARPNAARNVAEVVISHIPGAQLRTSADDSHSAMESAGQ